MKTLLHLLILIALCSTLAFSQIPRTLSYQGVLTDAAGNPRADSSYNITFSLYDSGSGGKLLWTEAKSLPTKRGLFSTALGDVTPFPDSLKFDRPYWLNIHVDGIGELSPRIPLTSVGYSMNALRADTASFSLVTNESIKGDMTVNGKLIISSSGDHLLTVEDTIHKNGFFIGTDGDYTDFIRVRPTAGKGIGLTNSGDIVGLFVNALDGNVGIRTTDPKSRLHLADRGSSWGNPRFLIENTNLGTDQVALGFRSEGIYDWEFGAIHDGRLILRDQLSKKSILTVYPGSSPKVVMDGRIVTDVLEITGADFAEPFEISKTDSLPLGSLVVIDPDNPGKLKQATESYDKRVAGVISGAGGIFPGVVVTKEGKSEKSQYVAMTGKVYALSTTTNGAIEPGDLLTTSSVPGHAMKATDKDKSFGTVIGKAMSSLNEGEGLVLVLVNLQ